MGLSPSPDTGAADGGHGSTCVHTGSMLERLACLCHRRRSVVIAIWCAASTRRSSSMAAVEGRLRISSPVGSPSLLVVELPRVS